MATPYPPPHATVTGNVDAGDRPGTEHPIVSVVSVRRPLLPARMIPPSPLLEAVARMPPDLKPLPLIFARTRTCLVSVRR